MVQRQVSLKGLKALTKHNIIKELERMKLSKEEYDEVFRLAEEIINNASHPDLKKKGIVKEIIGGMKRKRDNTPLDQPLKRGFMRKVAGFFVGESPNDEEYTLEMKRKILADALKDENEAEKEYETARNRTVQSMQEEEIARLNLISIQRERALQFKGTKEFLSARPELIKQLEEDQEREIDGALDLESRIIDGSAAGYEKNLQRKLADIAEYDRIYHLVTGRHLPNFQEIMARQSSSSSSSSSSASSSTEVDAEPSASMSQASSSIHDQSSEDELPPDVPSLPDQPPQPPSLAQRALALESLIDGGQDFAG